MLLRVPVNMFMYETSIRHSSGIASVLAEDGALNAKLKFDSSLLLMVALEYERHSRWSPWRAYIDTLESVELSPVVWSDGDRVLAAMQSPHMTRQVEALRGWFTSTHAELYPGLFEAYPAMFSPSVNTAASFAWAAMMCYSRSFDISLSDDVQWGLVPVMDVVNHSPWVSNEYYVDGASFDVRGKKFV